MPDRRYIAINKHGYRKEKKNKEQTWKNHAKVLQTKNVEISWNLSQSYKYISIFIWNMQDQNTQNKHIFLCNFNEIFFLKNTDYTMFPILLFLFLVNITGR